MINSTESTQLLHILILLFSVTVGISILTRLFGRAHKVDWDFCIGIPIMFAGYHTVAHVHSKEYGLQALTSIPKLFENDWVHFGVASLLLFTCVVTAEVIGYKLLHKHKKE